jgi:Type II secretion system (T2SS), protein M subtype b
VNHGLNSIGRYRLLCQVLIWRHGYSLALLALIVLVVLIAHMLVLPHQLHAQRVANEQLVQLRLAELRRDNSLSTLVQPSKDDEILDKLLDVSFSETGVTDILRSIVRIAQGNGVSLSQSEFHNSAQGHGGLSQLQVTLPVRASYPQLKKFVKQVLLEYPGISVDELVLKRASVAQNELEIRVKLSLWIKPGGRREAAQ